MKKKLQQSSVETEKKTLSNTFNGYGLFNDVLNPTLKTWNQANVFMNVRQNHGPEVGMSYLRKLKRKDQVALHQLMSHIQAHGYEQTRRDIMRKNNNG